MSHNSKTQSERSEKLDRESKASEKLISTLERELQALRSELTILKKEKPSNPEAQKLEKTIGTVLIDLAKEIPLVGRAVGWLQSWING